jgi:hypothetical protein
MGSSAFDIILVPVFWGTFWGIVAGMAILSRNAESFSQFFPGRRHGQT